VASEGTGALVGRAIARSYAQVLFSRSLVVGALVALATAFDPRVFAFGLGAVVVATGTTLVLRFDRDAVAEGVFGYAPLLVGLSIGFTFSGVTPAVAVLVFAAFSTVVVAAALRSGLAPVGLPTLSIPYLAIAYLLIGGATLSQLPFAPPRVLVDAVAERLPEVVAKFSRSLGALFFVPRADAGLLILVALVVHSRIAVLLSVLGFAAAYLLDAHVLSLADPGMLDTVGFNAMLTAMVLGGVYFVPSRASIGFAMVGVMLTVLVAAGSFPALARLGLPALVVPFNAAVLLLLLAMRQRTVDDAPRSVDFLPGTPEENLAFLRNRVARFGAMHAVRLRLPVRGTWTCTQGEDGRLTHRGAWRHAFDFEVAGEDGERHRGDGARLEQWRAYKLPVVAAAGGVVVRVVDGVHDNSVGKVNVEQNWGNLVVVRHAPQLYSLVAHLAPGSIRVREGQIVAPGAPLGACGNSGRSAVPHVHFQLQASDVPGAATLPCRFADAVRVGDGGTMLAEGGLIPGEGTAVRGLEPTDDATRLVRFPYGESARFRAAGAVETLECDLDLLGRSVIESRESGATLFFVQDDSLFVTYEVLGRGSEALDVISMALPRVPLEIDERMKWTDQIPRARRRSAVAQALFDFVSPLVDADSIEVTYAQRREDDRLVVEGAAPGLRTRAVFERDVGLVRAEVEVNGRVRAIERLRDEAN
jgi:urea transporter/murein DD-endopeptidase MepM/ murein hydrolase activator NlpD